MPQVKDQVETEVEVDEEQETLQDKAFAAFDEGVAEEGGAVETPTEAVKPDEEQPGGDPAPEAGGEPAASGEEDAAAKAKADEDREVAELGLKGRTETRFRELSAKARDASTKLEAIGGEEVVKVITQLGGREGLERALRDASDQRAWDEKLSEIGCTPQQFGQAMGYIAAFNSTDENVLRQARENLLKEIAVLDSRLGEKTERHDPLAAHPDLKQKVQTGALDEEDALEIARLRAGGQQARQQAEQLTAAQRQEQEQAAAVASLRTLGAELQQRDGPALFATKMAAIKNALDRALPKLPPAEWQTYARDLYEGIAAAIPAPAAQAPRVGKQPVRQAHATSGRQAHADKPANAFEAFDQGVAEARELGM